MKSLLQILSEAFMHERDLPEPPRRPFMGLSASHLENMMHDAYVSEYVNRELTKHYWKKAQEAGWDSSPGVRSINPPAEALPYLRKMGYHNHLSLTAAQHSSKIFNHLRFQHGFPYDDWQRISSIAKDTATSQLEVEHGIKANFSH